MADWNRFLSGIPAKDYIYQKESYEVQIKRAAERLAQAEAVLIGGGSGLSTAAGLVYKGSRFTDNFGEFIEKYGRRYMPDMYSAGFYPFAAEEERWGYWSKHAFLNRIEPPALPLYRTVFELVKEKDYFVLTTNVDHQFWKAGFEDERIFATQGDYGKIQCLKGCHKKTYDAVKLFTQMNQVRKDCKIPCGLVPKCPVCGGPMTMNLRCDQHFVEDGHWDEAAKRYGEFLERGEGRKVLLLELGVGFSTPVIIRFPFEKMMREEKEWSLVRLNLNQAAVPASLGERAVGINRDLMESITDIEEEKNGAGRALRVSAASSDAGIGAV